MDAETRLTIVGHACRWASNMLVEVGDSHSVILSPAGRAALANALSALRELGFMVESQRVERAPK